MKYTNLSLSLLLWFFISFSIAQQITVDNTISPQSLIENTLIQGCVDVSNISSPINGSASGFGSFGYFERGNSNFPFENGIVLTTGDANASGNNQNNTILNNGDSNWLTDTDLEAALGISETLNATSLQFNFTSISNTIQFKYILASEEYFGNFPCEYSDGFAFLIKRAGTNDPFTNIALVPGTAIPVNTNTVHDEIVGFCDASNAEYFDGYNLGDTNYNGRTSVLMANATIVPNVEYQIKLVIADQTDANYDSAVFIEGNSFNAAVDLGEDITTCASDVLLNADINNPNAIYQWFYNGVAITNAASPTYNAVSTGTYKVEVEFPLASTTCIIEDDILVVLSASQSAEHIAAYEICDDTGADGIELFDLSTKNVEVLAAVPPSNYSISYHLTEDAAQTGVNPILGSIQNTSNPQMIYVRIEDILNGCLAFSTIDLIVNSLPDINNPTPLVVCDDAVADGYTTIDLSQKNDEITNGQTHLSINYHTSQNDAENGTNSLPMPYVNAARNEVLFVSVTNSQTGCISTTSLELQILDNPLINTANHYIDACDLDHDGFATFNLNTIIPQVLQGLTGVSVTFHETFEDAESGVNAIINTTEFPNSIRNQQTVYIRVASNTTGCSSITPVELHTNLLLTATNIRDFGACDSDNDNSEFFDFQNITTTIINNIPNITIIFYESENDRANQINAIDTTSQYQSLSNPQTIYMALQSDTCEDEAEFDLLLYPALDFSSIGNIDICDDDSDGLTTIDLSQFDAAVTNNNEGFSVYYFLSEADADANTNPLPNLYTNSSNPFTLYPRISFDETGCSDVNAFQVNVLPAPVSNEPQPIIICDSDRDGISNINLADHISEVVATTTNRTITFHNTLDDANLDLNPILNLESYQAQTETVYIRIESNTTECYTTEELSIIVNTLPFVGNADNLINDYTICENESDGIGNFIFESKDTEALGGQIGKVVSYYLSESDALNKNNPIDKTSVYQNMSNPQTIFVRVENITDEMCYATSSFNIAIGTNPAFNVPTDWFVCDDMSNDGITEFDLSIKVDEISNDIADIQNVTFYSSEEDARNSTNLLPIEFSNTVNPQEIFVRVDNGTICNSITSFLLNVIQLPEVNPSQPIIVCDEDYDNSAIFDITLAESSILDVRQNDITISYFESETDAMAHINEITNPESYTNISNPQIVFIKITNTVSDCNMLIPLDLIVNSPPLVNDFQVYDICENNLASVNLFDINTLVTDASFNIDYSYFTNEADAITNTNALAPNYTYQSNFDTLFVRAEYNTTHCATIYRFNLRVHSLPIANQPNDLVACDDDYDGILDFDLASQNNVILGNQNASEFSVTYHYSLEHANTGTAVLEDNYFAYNTEIIYARVKNNSSGCYALTQFTIRINSLPLIDIPDQVVCIDKLPLLVSANTNTLGDRYLWSTGNATPEIEITEIGTYWVTVTSEFGCESTSAFNVTASEAATIEVTETVDFSDPNNITVTISGIGNYLYQLDDMEPQESNVFENVGLGYHTLTIIDLNGCANVTKEVLVIDAPKFMTPNNDGAFDTWHISGVETLPGTIIYIFDRYGKLLKQIAYNTPGWDGTFKGSKMPSDDYWFLAKVKRGNQSFEVKGHFALRR